LDTPASREATAKVIDKSVLVVGLHPDQATGAIVQTAVSNQKPFAVVPCCVFARLFPEREVNGVSVTTFSQLCLWLMSKHKNIRAKMLPFSGQNLVLYIQDYDQEPDSETIAIKAELLAGGKLDRPDDTDHGNN